MYYLSGIFVPFLTFVNTSEAKKPQSYGRLRDVSMKSFRLRAGKFIALVHNHMIQLDIIQTPAQKTGIFSRLPLETERLNIREFQLADAESLYELHRDPRATRYAGGTRTKDESFSALGRIINRARQTGFGSFALQLRQSGDLIGWAGIQQLPESTRFELLYALRPVFWGKGFATEASEQLLKAAFTLESDPLTEIHALVFPQNIASIRVLEKLGLSFTKHQFDVLTQRYACLYTITAAEFFRQSNLRYPN